MLSAHEKGHFLKRVKTLGDNELSLVALGMNIAADAAMEGGEERVRALCDLLRREEGRRRTAAATERLARTCAALESYETREEQLDCLRRMAWLTDEAREAGLLEDDEEL
ncbi:hypothetical protein [Rhodovulum euryhalinum]|uniref:Uncharacterized protein n=1 Tax=Rhodovulum euryhalinum TaxID=35805 RepID=A0A4R2KI91_9RHOB|nr:hypothetical protein [Rhodovulum euryhalinum]TCO70259.1 hypothetical protein EV655_11023 [Rhodovulum euryhalinum]